MKRNAILSSLKGLNQLKISWPWSDTIYYYYVGHGKYEAIKEKAIAISKKEALLQKELTILKGATCVNYFWGDEKI